MRAVVQRVTDCSVRVESKKIGEIQQGLLIYLGVSGEDGKEDADYLAKKIVNLRIFEDAERKINRSLYDMENYQVLVVSQFTLYGDVRKGRRPSFSKAAPPAMGEKLYEYFLSVLEGLGFPPQCGSFGSLMDVVYTNYGPMTILLDSKKLF
jgi:D-aminoacyl-tRNA deacylase